MRERERERETAAHILHTKGPLALHHPDTMGILVLFPPGGQFGKCKCTQASPRKLIFLHRARAFSLCCVTRIHLSLSLFAVPSHLSGECHWWAAAAEGASFALDKAYCIINLSSDNTSLVSAGLPISSVFSRAAAPQRCLHTYYARAPKFQSVC